MNTTYSTLSIVIAVVVLTSCSNEPREIIREYHDNDRLNVKSECEVIDSITPSGDTIKLLDGAAKFFYEDGTLKFELGYHRSLGVEKNENSGLPSKGRDGNLKCYNEEGWLEREYNYKKGIKLSYKGYNEDGILTEESALENGLVTTTTKYHNDGTVKEVKIAGDNEKWGQINYYNSTGKVDNSWFRLEDNKAKSIWFDDNGDTLTISVYDIDSYKGYYMDMYKNKARIKRKYIVEHNRPAVDSVHFFENGNTLTQRDLYRTERDYENDLVSKLIVSYHYEGGHLIQKDKYKTKRGEDGSYQELGSSIKYSTNGEMLNSKGVKLKTVQYVHSILQNNTRGAVIKEMGEPDRTYEVGITGIKVYIYHDSVIDEEDDAIGNLAIYIKNNSAYRIIFYEDGQTLPNY